MASAEPVGEILVQQQFELECPTWRFQARLLLELAWQKKTQPYAYVSTVIIVIRWGSK